MNNYPFLRMTVRHGNAATAAASVLLFAFIAWAGFPLVGWPIVLAAAFAAGLLYALGRCLTELVKLITDMLLPQ